MIILTSDFPSSHSPEVIEGIRATAKRPRVGWIAPASTLRHARFLTARRAFRSFDITQLVQVALRPRGPKALDLSAQFDVVYLSGGHPVRFRASLEAAGLLTQLSGFARDGGLIVAASGGAMQVTPNLSLFRLLKNDVNQVLAERGDYEGLDLVPFEFLPHLNRHGATFFDNVRQYSAAISNDIIAVEDGGAISVTDERSSCIAGRAVTYRRGQAL